MTKPKLPPVIAVVSLKGGAGKTTLAANLACEAARTHRVLAVDLDPQASLYTWSQVAPRADDGPLKVVRMSAEDFKEALPREAKGFDLVVIDTPPQVGIEAKLALAYCTVALVPVTPGPMDLWALGPTFDLIREAEQRRTFKALAVINRGDRRLLTTSCRQAIKAAGLPVADTIVRNYDAFPSAMADGQGVATWDDEHNAALDIRQLTREALS